MSRGMVSMDTGKKKDIAATAESAPGHVESMLEQAWV